MTRGTKKALWAAGLLAGAAGIGTAIFFAVKPATKKEEQPNANLPPANPPGGGGGGGGGGAPPPQGYPNPFLPLNPYEIGKDIGGRLFGKG